MKIEGEVTKPGPAEDKGWLHALARCLIVACPLCVVIEEVEYQYICSHGQSMRQRTVLREPERAFEFLKGTIHIQGTLASSVPTQDRPHTPPYPIPQLPNTPSSRSKNGLRRGDSKRRCPESAGLARELIGSHAGPGRQIALLTCFTHRAIA